MTSRTHPPFNLRRYYVVTSFALVLVGVLIFSVLQTRAAKIELIGEGEAAAIRSATRLSFLIHRDFVERMETSGRSVDLQDEAQFAKLHELVVAGIRDWPIIKVNIFDDAGTVIYSTDRATVGREATAHSHVLEALAGEIISELEIEEYEEDEISGPVPEAVLETYIPLTELADSPLTFWAGMAVFETYQDASAILDQIRIRTRRAMLQSWGIGFVIFGALYLLIRRADTILQSQYHELRRWNSDLENRVRSRTSDLERSSAEMQRLFDGITDGIAVVSEDLRVQRMNDSLGALAGGGEERTHEGEHCYVAYANRTTPCVGCPAQETLRTHAPASTTVTWQCNGEPRHFEVTTFPFTPGGHLELRVIEHVRDITHRQETEQQLIHAERLASIGVLAAGVAHEINNPLGSMAHCVAGLHRRIVEEGPEADADVRDYFEIVSREIRRCKEITRSLLDFAHQSPSRRTVTNLSTIVLDAYRLLRFRFDRLGVVWKTEFPDEEPFIVTDSAKLHQVVFNLLHNALDASADCGGTITCRIRVEEEYAVLELQDQGIGMRPETIERIFNPFFTTKPASQGTGLGLSLAYGFIREMGGRLEATSDGPNRGSSFTVRLPVTPTS